MKNILNVHNIIVVKLLLHIKHDIINIYKSLINRNGIRDTKKVFLLLKTSHLQRFDAFLTGHN